MGLMGISMGVDGPNGFLLCFNECKNLSAIRLGDPSTAHLCLVSVTKRHEIK